jgi:hypothetical protein
MHAQATAFTQLPAAPLPVVEILEEHVADSVPTRFTDDGPVVGRRGEVVEARAFARWFVNGTNPSVKPPEVTTLAREGTIARARLWNCASSAPNTHFSESLALVAGQLNTHLPKTEATEVWAAVQAAPCYAKLSAQERRWIDLFRVVGGRIPNAMATIGVELLSSDPDITSNLREYATLAAATGLLKTGRNVEARALLDQQLAKLPAERRALPWFLMVRGLALDDRPAKNSGIQPIAERPR